jgi:hypothetical protein
MAAVRPSEINADEIVKREGISAEVPFCNIVCAFFRDKSSLTIC